MDGSEDMGEKEKRERVCVCLGAVKGADARSTGVLECIRLKVARSSNNAHTILIASHEPTTRAESERAYAEAECEPGCLVGAL